MKKILTILLIFFTLGLKAQTVDTVHIKLAKVDLSTYLLKTDTTNKWVNTIANNATLDSLIYFVGSTRYAIPVPKDTTNQQAPIYYNSSTKTQYLGYNGGSTVINGIVNDPTKAGDSTKLATDYISKMGKVGVVTTISALQSFNSVDTLVVVTDTLQGGLFVWSATGTVDNGVVFLATGKGSGYWVRQYDHSKGVNVDWFIGNNVTAGIQAAINATPSQGGVVWFGARKYKTTGNIIINNNVTLRGANGNYGSHGNGGYVFDSTGTVIESTSPTDTLLIVNAAACNFENIALVNIASTTPTSGYGLYMPNGGAFKFRNSAIYGFYNNFFVDNAFDFVIDGFDLSNPVDTNLIIQGTLSPDTGDNSISNGQFGSNSTSVVTGIAYHSSGGLRINNIKINPRFGGKLLNAIDINITGSTSDFQINNSSIEGFSGNGILVRHAGAKTFANVGIIGCQFYPVSMLTGNAISVTGIDRVLINDNFLIDGNSNVNPAIKIDSSYYVTVLANQFYGWSNNLAVTNTSGIIDTCTTIVGLKANDNAVVHLAGNETISGNKTFSGTNSFPGISPTGGANFVMINPSNQLTYVPNTLLSYANSGPYNNLSIGEPGSISYYGLQINSINPGIKLTTSRSGGGYAAALSQAWGQNTTSGKSALLSEIGTFGTIGNIDTTGVPLISYLYLAAGSDVNWTNTNMRLYPDKTVGLTVVNDVAGDFLTRNASNGLITKRTASEVLSDIGGQASIIKGTATLSAGTVTVSSTAVTSSSKIFITRNTTGGTLGFLSVPTASIVAGTSFVINSSSNTETSTVNWMILN